MYGEKPYITGEFGAGPMNRHVVPEKPVVARPKKARTSAKSTRLEARLSPYALKVIRRAAEIEGRSMSDFVVAAAEKAASRTIERSELIAIAINHQQAFFKAMLAPPKPGAAWARARAAHERLVAKGQ
jgi:uncharacterized protein (DUF1778 family)